MLLAFAATPEALDASVAVTLLAASCRPDATLPDAADKVVDAFLVADCKPDEILSDAAVS